MCPAVEEEGGQAIAEHFNIDVPSWRWAGNEPPKPSNRRESCTCGVHEIPDFGFQVSVERQKGAIDAALTPWFACTMPGRRGHSRTVEVDIAPVKANGSGCRGVAGFVVGGWTLTLEHRSPGSGGGLEQAQLDDGCGWEMLSIGRFDKSWQEEEEEGTTKEQPRDLGLPDARRHLRILQLIRVSHRRMRSG
ncbi:hypothetical protein GALMADRAFT_137564 [Galerina marginata CBS 339.88]|uniref:Uncharacterized protein n=1 Tax=Galerina marginata (strain CBS 339.88) TaxID=685588 RepID=A0A067THS1_GALM3|nr:hypothetical protein GALMADRAFT_137564 [Galerina marginata CBS 339.88]